MYEAKPAYLATHGFVSGMGDPMPLQIEDGVFGEPRGSCLRRKIPVDVEIVAEGMGKMVDPQRTTPAFSRAAPPSF